MTTTERKIEYSNKNIYCKLIQFTASDVRRVLLIDYFFGRKNPTRTSVGGRNLIYTIISIYNGIYPTQAQLAFGCRDACNSSLHPKANCSIRLQKHNLKKRTFHKLIFYSKLSCMLFCRDVLHASLQNNVQDDDEADNANV